MQLNFLFPTNIDVYDVRNFIIHDGNRNIFDFITSSLLLNNNIYMVSGPKNSGKTYICNIWSKLKGAKFLDAEIFKKNKTSFVDYINNMIQNGQKYILEDIESININEEFLLYLFNIIIEKKAILLITSKKVVGEFDFKLPDLISRFNNVVNFIMNELNDESKQKIILKLLSDRQMNIDSDVLAYISRKISGNYNEIFNFVNKLEEMVNNSKIKRISINSIKSIL